MSDRHRVWGSGTGGEASYVGVRGASDLLWKDGKEVKSSDLSDRRIKYDTGRVRKNDGVGRVCGKIRREAECGGPARRES